MRGAIAPLRRLLPLRTTLRYDCSILGERFRDGALSHDDVTGRLRGVQTPLSFSFPLSFILPRKERGTKGVRSGINLLAVRLIG